MGDLSGENIAGADASTPYDVAGGTGRRSRAWRVGSFGPNTAINYALDELRRKSRDQTRKNPYAAVAVDRLVSNIIGTGISPKSAAQSTAGKAGDEAAAKADAAFRSAVSDLWLRWTDQADSVGAHDFYGLQALAVRGMVEGGESFIRLRTRRLSDGLPVPLQLQVIEGDHCPHLKTEPANNIRSGIQYSPIGRRTGYYLLREHPGDGIMAGVSTGEMSLVPAEEVAHLYRPLRPGQDRGEPWLTRALRTLYDLDAYLDAELTRKKTAAMLVGFIKRAAELDQPLGADPVAEDGAAVLSLEPGTMQVLLDGEDVVFSDPKDVGPNFDAFVRQSLRGVAAAAGILYEELSGDYGQLNDRTLRASLNAFRRAAEAWQHQLVVFQVCRPIWTRWMDLALLSGALKIPPGMTREQAYAVEWQPARWAYIHPVQDIEAQQLEIQSGFASRSQLVTQRGYDSAAIDEENAADNKRADELGLVYTSDGRQKLKVTPIGVPAIPKADGPAE